MGFNDNRFLSPLFKLFGKKLAGVPPSPSNSDVIQFNSTSNEWELTQGIIGNAVQSSSNVGNGAGLALPRVLDDLPFKTLVDGVEIVITVSATELTFSIGAIAISKITGLQVILDSKVENGINIGTGAEVFANKAGVNLRFRRLIDSLEILITQNTNDLAFSIGAIAQSKITGLVTALLTKIETLTNVGGFAEIVKAKVGTNVDVRTIQAGTNVTIVQNANDLEISSTNTGQDNTASNVGTGVNVFLQKLGVDLEFRTLLANAEILIVQNALDLAFSIGAIAQSKITGLVTALGTKIDTIVNVGTGVGLIFRDIVGTTANLKTLLAGTGISITNNADDIEISVTGGGGVNVKSGSDSVGIGDTKTINFTTAFISIPNVVVGWSGNSNYGIEEEGFVLTVFNITVNSFDIKYFETSGAGIDPALFQWIATDGGNP